ncbi:hypothetical protein [Deinococcus planocerae]|uniref:hypothetical protein n=1 Tax=Deinococcus planocerae TaxID=1737569 RepID=UPI000C7E8867|nr:hypothetical protein [Deinococcus planocerae]
MPLEFVAAPVLASAGLALFRHFEEGTRPKRRLAKWAVYFVGVGLTTRAVGRPWSLVWTFGPFALGTVFHLSWCARHGIHPLTAEPRARYRELRGWPRQP